MGTGQLGHSETSPSPHLFVLGDPVGLKDHSKGLWLPVAVGVGEWGQQMSLLALRRALNQISGRAGQPKLGLVGGSAPGEPVAPSPFLVPLYSAYGTGFAPVSQDTL